MQTTVGVSAGSDVVCSALLHTAADGTETFDYRTVTADNSHADVGDLVASSVEMIVAGREDDVDAVAVTYRSEQQAEAVRLAARHRDITLVPEVSAALTYLRHTGEVARYTTVVIVDVGASGTSVAVVDQVDGTVYAADRSHDVGGDAFDRRLFDLLSEQRHSLSDTSRSDRDILAARLRTAKEHLSASDSVNLEHVVDDPITITRAQFEAAVDDELTALSALLLAVVATSGRTPCAVALIGGGAHVPAVVSATSAALEIPIVRTDEPDAALAKGAALLVRSSPSGSFPVHRSVARPRAAPFVRTLGVLAAGLTVAAFVLVYGVGAVVPADDTPVSPAATASADSSPTVTPSQETNTDTLDPSSDLGASSYDTGYGNTNTWAPATAPDYPVTASQQVATTAPATTTPSLRPAPGLPSIVLPLLPPWPTVAPNITTRQPSNETSPQTTPPDVSATTPVETTTPEVTTTTPPPTTSTGVTAETGASTLQSSVSETTGTPATSGR